ncbi:MAG: hypothetical protein ABJO36_10175 [Litorimonas sp.]
MSKSKRVATLGRGVKCDEAVDDWLATGLVDEALATRGDEIEISPIVVDRISGRSMDMGILSLLLDGYIQ